VLAAGWRWSRLPRQSRLMFVRVDSVCESITRFWSPTDVSSRTSGRVSSQPTPQQYTQ
jgi:hypothetical protein